ncbi:AtpZ/AtpI family protein [Candidatus Berkelbacteria bacterium]|nr:AtpZ/AtpI family protein [Candidatus Berkelbacteria bacterium]
MNKKVLYVLSLVGKLGFVIALPAAVFAFGGAYLDKKLETTPLFILLGLGLAVLSSVVWVYKFVKSIEE